jgi:glucose-1-phosphate thymidylyltransferase
MWGIIPAAGAGSRIQPLAFSKELLPAGCWFDGETERPRAVSEYIIERMINAGATKICFVISPGKSDILEYYGSGLGPAGFAYVVQPHPAGLCDAIFRALPLVPPEERVVIGLPDTVWFPENGLRALPEDGLSFLLFPVEHPEFFDAVVTDEKGRVLEIQVKQRGAAANWIWGALKMPGSTLEELAALWEQRDRRDEYLGTLVNAYLRGGHEAKAVRAGESYVDIGTLHGYRAAINLLSDERRVTGDVRHDEGRGTRDVAWKGLSLEALKRPPARVDASTLPPFHPSSATRHPPGNQG